MSKTINPKKLTQKEIDQLMGALRDRFENNMNRHADCDWSEVSVKLKSNPEKIQTIHAMEITGGEPDVIGRDEKTGAYIFCDCAAESPAGRRSLCYDDEALEARKENKPIGSAKGMAKAMGIEILNEEQYRQLQSIGAFDAKTSSWLETPADLRKLGGALFGDFRYGRVFTYHNGVQSYYAARGFRGILLL